MGSNDDNFSLTWTVASEQWSLRVATVLARGGGWRGNPKLCHRASPRKAVTYLAGSCATRKWLVLLHRTTTATRRSGFSEVTARVPQTSKAVADGKTRNPFWGSGNSGSHLHTTASGSTKRAARASSPAGSDPHRLQSWVLPWCSIKSL